MRRLFAIVLVGAVAPVFAFPAPASTAPVKVQETAAALFIDPRQAPRHFDYYAALMIKVEDPTTGSERHLGALMRTHCWEVGAKEKIDCDDDSSRYVRVSRPEAFDVDPALSQALLVVERGRRTHLVQWSADDRLFYPRFGPCSVPEIFALAREADVTATLFGTDLIGAAFGYLERGTWACGEGNAAGAELFDEIYARLLKLASSS